LLTLWDRAKLGIAMIHVEGVWKSFHGTAALRGVSLTVGDGDAVLLTGPSGAGKTTLLRLVFAAERPDRGELSVAGRSLGKLSDASIPYVRRNIGVVFQDFKLLGDRSALENVAMPLQILGLGARDIRARAAAALDAVGLGARCDARAATLSGGEQQRVAVARAIVGEPAILLGDEPTGNLDPQRTRELLELFEAIHQRGTTLLVATHDPQVVDFGVEHGWRCARLVDGELLDVDLPPSRPVRHDEETEGFATREDPDDTEVIRVVRA
jgi:cell division transport system ATP-binding protein